MSSVDENDVVRQVKGDTADFKDVIYSRRDGAAYAEVYWRRADMSEPVIELNLFDGERGVEWVRVMAKVLDAAAREAEDWIALPPWERGVEECP